MRQKPWKMRVATLAQSAIEEAPGGTTVVNLFQQARELVNVRRAQSYFLKIAKAANVPQGQLIGILRESFDESWAHEGIESSFRMMMDAIDEDARQCIAVLVAHYLIEQTAPDYAYRRIGRVLSQSTGKQLVQLKTLLDRFAAFKNDHPDTTWVQIFETRGDQNMPVVWMHGLAAESEEFVHTEPFSPERPRDALKRIESEVLITLNTAKISKSHPNGMEGKLGASIDEGDVEDVLLLTRCLGALDE